MILNKEQNFQICRLNFYSSKYKTFELLDDFKNLKKICLWRLRNIAYFLVNRGYLKKFRIYKDDKRNKYILIWYNNQWFLFFNFKNS